MTSRRSLWPRATFAAALALLPACSALIDFDGLDTGAPLTPSEAGAATDADRAVDGGDREAGDAAGARSTYAERVLADQPLAYWRFGERSGTRAVDAVGRSDGTYLGRPVLGVEGALASDPDTAWATEAPPGGMSAGRGFDFPGTAAFSLEAWIRPSVSDSDYRMVFAWRSSDAAGRQGYGLYVHDGRVAFERIIGGDRVGVSSQLVAGGPFRHVAATYDGARLSLFLDGALVDAAADARPAPATEAALLVGINGPDAPPFLGAIDEAAIHGRALTAEQVRARVEAAR